MPAEGRENPLLKKGNSDAFFREKYLTKNMDFGTKCPELVDTLTKKRSGFSLKIEMGGKPF